MTFSLAFSGLESSRQSAFQSLKKMPRKSWKAGFHLLRERPMNRAILPNTERRVSANQRLVPKPFAIGVLQGRHKTLGVVSLAGIEAEHLLVNVGIEVEGTRSDVGSVKCPLQGTTKSFR